jgi:nucleoside-diphosphate kinase
MAFNVIWSEKSFKDLRSGASSWLLSSSFNPLNHISRIVSAAFVIDRADLSATWSSVVVDYADLKGKPFFPGLIKYMASGPVVAMVWQGLDAVKTGRAMLGATNPLASNAGEY